MNREKSVEVSSAKGKELKDFWTPQRKMAAQPLSKLQPEKRHALKEHPNAANERRSEPRRPPPREHVVTAADTFQTEPVPDVSAYPASAVGKLWAYFDGEPEARVGSAWLCGKSAVITAADFVFDPQQKRFASSLAFEAGYDHGTALATSWATQMVVLPDWQNSGQIIDDFAGLILADPIGNSVGWLGSYANYPINQGQWLEYGYPYQPVPGYPFDGEQMWRTFGAYETDFSWLITAGGNMTAGAVGGPWILPGGYANGMTCRFTDTADEISPYFGNEFLSIYNWLKDNGAT
jgi:hypothetical protein